MKYKQVSYWCAKYKYEVTINENGKVTECWKGSLFPSKQIEALDSCINNAKQLGNYEDVGILVAYKNIAFPPPTARDAFEDLGASVDKCHPPSKNRETLKSFIDYCIANPELRFWQALRNWSGWGYVYVSTFSLEVFGREAAPKDTFYWEGKYK